MATGAVDDDAACGLRVQAQLGHAVRLLAGGELDGGPICDIRHRMLFMPKRLPHVQQQAVLWYVTVGLKFPPIPNSAWRAAFRV
jgi:hypothetical protein